MAIEWVIPRRPAAASRPGFGGTNPAEVDPADVEAWLDEARVQGIRSILCLLDEGQLGYYRRVPGGLLETYRRAGMAVSSVPATDLPTPPIPPRDPPSAWRGLRQ